MTAFDPATVEYHVRRLDDEELAAFVADLWGARGYETTPGEGVVVARNGTESLRVRTRAAPATAPGETEEADVVIALDGDGPGGGDVRVVDAATLVEMLGYAVDRSDAREMGRRHLGAPPEDLKPPRSARLRRRADVLVSTGPVLAVGVLALVLVVGGVAGVTVLSGSGGEDTTLSGTGMVPASTPTPVGSPGNDGKWLGGERFREASPALVGPSGNSSLPPPRQVRWGHPDPSLIGPSGNGPLPPGVNSTGIQDIDALAAAHERALANQSHTIWVDWYRPWGYRSDGAIVQRDIDITAEGDRFLIELTEEVEGNRSRMGAIYHDGSTTYAASWDEENRSYNRVFPVPTRRINAPTPASLREEVVTQYLSTPTTNVTGVVERDGRTLYRIVGEGRPNMTTSMPLRNYSVEALVDSRGFVRDVTVRVSVVHPDISNRRSFRIKREITYDRVGTTTVAPPRWYERHTGR